MMILWPAEIYMRVIDAWVMAAMGHNTTLLCRGCGGVWRRL
jgi:hypothetical protein